MVMPPEQPEYMRIVSSVPKLYDEAGQGQNGSAVQPKRSKFSYHRLMEALGAGWRTNRAAKPSST